MAKSSHRLASRKLWAGIFGAVSPIVTQAITGAVGWPVAAGLSVVSAVGYLLAQGAEDAAGAKRKAE
jgi:hypothetical protein